jgi:hypothetical protein
MIKLILSVEEIIYEITDVRLLSADVVTKKVESDKKGQPGLIVYDSMPIELVIKDEPLLSTLNETNISRIEGTAAPNKYILGTVQINISGTWAPLFSGIVDFESIEFTDAETVICDLVDKISALKLMENRLARTRISVKNGRNGVILPNLPPLNYADSEYYQITIQLNSGNFAIVVKRYVRVGEFLQWQHVNFGSTPLFTTGQILEVYDGADYRKLAFITRTYMAENPEYPGEYDTWGQYAGLSDDVSGSYYIDGNTEAYLSTATAKKLYYYKDEFYGPNPITYKENGVVKSFNAISLIKNLITNYWPDIVFQSYTNLFQIPLDYWVKLIDDMPMEKHPLDVLKYLANTMQCYLYIDSAGVFCIKSKSLLYESNVPSTRILSEGDLQKHSINYYWDKIIDAVTVTVLTPYDYKGSYEKIKDGLKIKPTNAIEVEVFTDASHITQEECDALAEEIANSYMNFYGKRRSVLNTTNRLSAITINYNLTNNLIFRGKQYFIASAKINIKNELMDVEAVNIDDLKN